MARKQENPGDLFKYLASNEIGQELSMYYFEYASFKETTGYIREANEIYQLGLNRKAKPVEKLRKQYEKFKDRTTNLPAEPIISSSPKPKVSANLVPSDGNNSSRPQAQNDEVRGFNEDTVESMVNS